MKPLLTLGIAALVCASAYALASAPSATQPGTITGPNHPAPRSVVITATLDPAAFADVREVTATAFPSTAGGSALLKLRVEREGQQPLVVDLPPRGQGVPGLSVAENAAVRSVVDFERRALLHGLGITP